MTAPMAKRDDDTPATKRDLKLLATKEDLLGVKKDLLTTKEDLQHEMQEMREEILRHFDMTVETIRHDLAGANRDEIETIKDRVTKVERHTGLIPV